MNIWRGWGGEWGGEEQQDEEEGEGGIIMLTF